ncbi:MAG: UDP-N-acetylmuramate--L-alanine ligase, partial [Clostridia bacterium]|nr:UDP-N-acetylmuramate--L-alanine ligase [Clostridia bacterium]
MKIHFVGIGGISMSALAKLMLLWGHKVSGSDKVYSKNAIELVEWGAKVYLGCDRQAIDESDLIVYTASILDADEELTYAKSTGKMMMSRECFLRELSLEYDMTVAVSGSHGKTTVTSMLSDIFYEAGLNYTAHIGGH